MSTIGIRISSPYREAVAVVISTTAILDGIKFVAGLYGSLKTDDAIKKLEAHVQVLYILCRRLSLRIEEVRDELLTKIHESEYRSIYDRTVSSNSFFSQFDEKNYDQIRPFLHSIIYDKYVIGDAIISQLDRDWIRLGKPEYYLAYLDLFISNELIRFSSVALVEEGKMSDEIKIGQLLQKKEKMIQKLDYAYNILAYIEQQKYEFSSSGFLECREDDDGSILSCDQDYGFSLKGTDKVTIVTKVTSSPGGAAAIEAHDKALAIAKEKVHDAIVAFCRPLAQEKWDSVYGEIRSSFE
ncbi:MAG TPA: hypothetical protein PK812_04855 [Beijerinckiaceae bacterium]|nr:hypothetical protein [Beijerinckiaceae bacterium]